MGETGGKRGQMGGHRGGKRVKMCHFWKTSGKMVINHPPKCGKWWFSGLMGHRGWVNWVMGGAKMGGNGGKWTIIFSRIFPPFPPSIHTPPPDFTNIFCPPFPPFPPSFPHFLPFPPISRSSSFSSGNLSGNLLAQRQGVTVRRRRTGTHERRWQACRVRQHQEQQPRVPVHRQGHRGIRDSRHERTNSTSRLFSPFR